MRHVTPETRQKIAEWEGVVLYAYDDATGKQARPGLQIKGTLTIGIGHTGPDVAIGQTITRERADALLANDLNAAERTVESAVKVPLSDPQFGTLVSFCFNAGAGAFLSSTLLKKLNQGRYELVPAELMKWTKTHISGKLVQSPGLVSRRTKEAAYWSSGVMMTPASESQQSSVPVKDGPNWFTSETVSTGVTAVSGASALAAGNGPFQYALAAVFVIAACVGIYFFVIKRIRPA